MADIFISYSRDDRALTEALAPDLEACGYTVWWDTGLLSGQHFPDEAHEALRLKKLAPLRTAKLAAHDIPLPFNTMHANLIESGRF
jgi:hypothetical protein